MNFLELFQVQTVKLFAANASEAIVFSINPKHLLWILLGVLIIVGVVLLVQLIRLVASLIETAHKAEEAINKANELIDKTSELVVQATEITERVNNSYKQVNSIIDYATTGLSNFVISKFDRK